MFVEENVLQAGGETGGQRMWRIDEPEEALLVVGALVAPVLEAGHPELTE